ncbi:ACP S-malonyltransferase [Paenibacillus albicereus]|uniref:[acyl-carrier-protein] S-malonyltransferase n=1 Tax=Paenibacillus albicereus TaxID=2726185 RepID=A0A6H2GVD7_9BACL|nr:ACP S-malonyltransferase [Paenibacillus albicereus]QJC51352.1 ACP S-malonyltransferase [Paenibacillus albicereus]
MNKRLAPALLFPGQGSQHPGMGRQLMEHHPEARAAIEESGDAIGTDLVRLLRDGSMEELTRTELAQPAILAVSVAAYRVYRGSLQGPPPCWLAGHSLGEFSALACAGALALGDAVRLVQARGRLMAEAARRQPGGMVAALGIAPERAEAICREVTESRRFGVVVPANYNSASQTVLSGQLPALEEAERLVREAGGSAARLAVGGAFHSPLMATAREAFGEELSAVRLAPPLLPVLSSVTGKRMPDTESGLAELLQRQLTAPVRWTAVMAKLAAAGASEAVEAGPGGVLKRLAAGTVLRVLAMEEDGEREELAHRIRRRRMLSFLEGCLAVAVGTRNEEGDALVYSREVEAPARELERLLREAESAPAVPDGDRLEQAERLLGRVLAGKRMPEGERLERVARLAAAHGLRPVATGAR